MWAKENRKSICKNWEELLDSNSSLKKAQLPFSVYTCKLSTDSMHQILAFPNKIGKNPKHLTGKWKK